MKTLRQICAVTILTLALVVSVFAGQIECPGVVSPPPPTSEASTSTSSNITTTVILAIIGLIR